MTTYMLIWCAAMYICGQLFHLFVQKIPAMKTRAKAANFKFTLKDYWNEEWYMICGALVLGMMLTIGASEIVQWKPQVADWMRWFYGFVGYFFNSLIVGKLGQYEKKLSRIIDIKTNIADKVEGTDAKGKPDSMTTSAPGEKN